MGRANEVFLRSPDGVLHTTAEAAQLMGRPVNAVRCGCIWPKKEYKGWKVVRPNPPPTNYMLEEINRRKGLGYSGVTLLELYEQYLWCRESPKMLTIMKDFAGTSDIAPMIKTFEKWRKEGR